MKIGILCEKPSQARNWAAALGGNSGTFDGCDYVISNASGHIYELLPPEKQVPKDKAEEMKAWKMDTLPWPTNLAYKKALKVDKDGYYKKVSSAIDRAFAGCDAIAIATDTDPTGEGDLLGFEVLIEQNLLNRKLFRFNAVDETPKTLQAAFKNRTPLSSDPMQSGMYRMAEGRNRWDFLSMQFSRAATLVSGSGSVLREGRLKSVYVELVGAQEEARNNYKKIPYYENAFKDENGNVFTAKDPSRYSSPDLVPDLGITQDNVIVGKPVHKTTKPPQLIDLAGLASKLAKKINSKTCLDVYQKMYEANVCSYPRTEDKKISQAQFDELLPAIPKIAALVGVDASKLSKKSRSSHISEKISHGANRPGLNVPNSLEELDAKYGKGASDIYRELAISYLAMLMPDYEYDTTTAHLEHLTDYTCSISNATDLGWKGILKDDDDDEDLGAQKSFGKVAKHEIKESFPPKPEQPTMKWLMKKLERYNVGTGATRTSTLAAMTAASKTQQLVDKKGVLSLTELGWTSYKICKGCNISSPESTAALLENMQAIADGKMTIEKLLDTCTSMLLEDIETMRANAATHGMKERGSSSADKVTVNFKGKDEQINKSFGGHDLTDDELAALSRGETISFTANKKDGSGTYTANMKLGYREFKGKNYCSLVFDETKSPNAGGATVKYKGKDVSLPKEFGGHTFTQAEYEALEAGKTISFTANKKDGSGTYTANMKLGEKTYQGKKSVGLVFGMATEFCGHKFTQDEIATLEKGGSIKADDFVSKKGNKFSATVKYKNGKFDMSFD